MILLVRCECHVLTASAGLTASFSLLQRALQPAVLSASNS